MSEDSLNTMVNNAVNLEFRGIKFETTVNFIFNVALALLSATLIWEFILKEKKF